MNPPVKALRRAVQSYEPWLLESGAMSDPVIGEPTQYGTAYHAWSQAVLADFGPDEEKAERLDKATRGLSAALAHLQADPIHVNTVSTFDRFTGDVGRVNHRDFFWPAVLKTYRYLRLSKAEGIDALAEQIGDLDIEQAFASRPPGNWAAVWLSGEWLRLQENLSPLTVEQFDAWLDPFFDSRILLEQGLYQEPGHPNSYDLFTRYHLADILVHDYHGRHQARLECLLESGLRRSLAVQLSDGALASAHRSTGQTWTLGAQIAFFALAGCYFADSRPDLREQAEAAARLAFAAFVSWQRPDGPYSPVENLLPPAFRVGYESYTADGHYGNLAMGFLASAIDHGFVMGPISDLDRAPQAYIEADPTWRGVLHAGRYSVHINTAPAPAYDGFGLVDFTCGPGRLLQMVSSVHPIGQQRFFNLGLALRPDRPLAPLTVLSQQDWLMIEPLHHGEEEASVAFAARPRGVDWHYHCTVCAHPNGIDVEERVHGYEGSLSLLVPYVRDVGGLELTSAEVCPLDRSVEIFLTHGDEQLVIEVEGQLERQVNLPHGYENRRGLCGLLRLDLAKPKDGLYLHYRIHAAPPL